MLMKRMKKMCRIIYIAIVSLLVTGCSANSVSKHQFIYQPSDETKSCLALHSEMNYIRENITKAESLGGRMGSALSFGEKVDVDAFKKRYEHLNSLYLSKGCSSSN